MSTKEGSRGRTRLWIPITLFAAFAVGMTGLSFFLLSSWSELRTATPEEAERAFADRRAALGAGPAYIELGIGGEVRVRRELEGTEEAELETLHVLAWEPAKERLSSAAFPFWFVRMKVSETFPLGTFLIAFSRDWDHLQLKVTDDDLERRGKGLVLDHVLEDGRWLLLWTE